MENIQIPFMPEKPILAHAYVPFQQWDDKLYTPEEGLMNGTIFPELNQPMSMYDWGKLYE